MSHLDKSLWAGPTQKKNKGATICQLLFSNTHVYLRNITKGDKMKIDTKTTQDLFKVENCPNCDGDGKSHIEKNNYEIIEDCDICKGTGVI